VKFFDRGSLLLMAGLLVHAINAPAARAQEEGEEEEGVSAIAEAYERTRPRAKDVVQSRAFYKAKRIEIFPHFYASALNNSFAVRFLVLSGLGVSYHFGESFFIEGTADYFPDYPFFNDLKSLNYAIAEYVSEGETIPLVPKERMSFNASLGFSPLYGKINLVSSYVQNLDVSFLTGVGILNIREDTYQVAYDPDVGTTLIGPIVDAQTLSERDKWFLSPSLGLTTRFFLNRWLTLRADTRFHGYVQEITDYLQDPTTGANGEQVFPTKRVFKTSFILSIGLSGFLGAEKSDER